MRVPMMGVVHMPVLVKERLVHMLVLVFFGKMQIHARRHEPGSTEGTARARSHPRTVCWPGQYERTGEYGHCANKHTAIDVLTEEDPGDRYNGETLGVEKERTGATRCGRQSRHQQRRTENAAEKDDQAKPREIAPAQRHVCGSARKPGAQANDAEADSGTEIEWTREQQRVGYA
jgi:hypothetical protein